MSEQKPIETTPSEAELRDVGVSAQLSLVAVLQQLPERLHIPRRVLVGGAVLLVIVVVGLIALLPIVFGVDQDDLEQLGYPGVFIANFIGTATVFIPVPGLTAAGQALIIVLADRLNPFAVAMVASAGMTSAETTAYLAGRVGRAISEEREVRFRGRLGRMVRRTVHFVDWLMDHYGFLTLLALSAVPNPVFEFAGITAGAVHMNFVRFIVAVGIGKTIRALILAYAGDVFVSF